MKDDARELVCDGCGQAVSAGHMARRLQRLEWATRYRPVHIRTVLLGAAAPPSDAEFFYSPDGALAGEAAQLAEVTGLRQLDQPKDQVQAAFQRAGFYAAQVLECPIEGGDFAALPDLLAKRLPSAMARIRRSLKPKTVALVSPHLDALIDELSRELAGCRIVTKGGKAFNLQNQRDVGLLGAALAASPR